MGLFVNVIRPVQSTGSPATTTSYAVPRPFTIQYSKKADVQLSLLHHTEQTEKLKKKRTKNKSRSMISPICLRFTLAVVSHGLLTISP